MAEVDSLVISVEATSKTAADNIDKLITKLQDLRNEAKDGAGLDVLVQKLKDAADQLKDKMGLNDLTKGLNQTKDSVQSLTTEIQKVPDAVSDLSDGIKALAQNSSSLANANKNAAGLSRSFGSGVIKAGLFGTAMKFVSKHMANWLAESNAYVENLNLFTVTMGDATEAALEYAETVKDALGIDPSEWIRNQGMFKQITSGFGVAAEKANLMSKNLTQLGYDISSFYNISIEESMMKLQSAISGELEPVRRLGYAIDVATLQQVAYNHGISMSVNNMNQAQKSQLRYLALMEQSGNVMGDMARTVQTPANAMRILRQEATQLARAAGNVLIPALQAIIPVAQAIIEAVTEVVQAIANLFGFKLPKIDYSSIGDVSTGVEDVEDAFGGASSAAKEFKRQLIGIDELTILQKPDDSSRGGGGGNNINGEDLGLELPEYDFLKGLQKDVSSFATKLKKVLNPVVNWIKNNLKSILSTVKVIGTALLAWEILRKVRKWLENADTIFQSLWKCLRDSNTELQGMDKWMAGLGGIIIGLSGYTIEFQGFREIGKGSAKLLDYIKAAIGAALGIVGTKIALTAFGASGPWAWGIGIGLALTIGVAATLKGWDEAMADIRDQMVFDTLLSAFDGDYSLTDLQRQFDDFAQSVSSGFKSMGESGQNIDAIRDSISETIENINLFNRELAIGAIDVGENVESIKASFESLKEDTTQIFEEMRRVIITGLAGSTGEIASALGVDLPEFTALMNSWIDEGIAHAEGLYNEMTAVADAYNNGQISKWEYESQITSLAAEYQAALGDTTVLDNFSQSVADWKTNLDLTDIVTDTGVNMTALSDIFSGFETSYTDAVTSINDGADEMGESMEALVNNVRVRGEELSDTALKDLSLTLLSNEANRSAQIATMQDYYGEIIDSIQQELIGGLRDEVDALEQSYDELSPWQKFFVSETEYVSEGLQTYQNDVVSPIMSEIQSSMERLGIEGEPWAGDAMSAIMDGLVGYDYDAFGGVVGTHLNDVGTLIENALKDVETDSVPVAETTGKNIALGILQGTDDGITKNTESYKSTIDRLPDFARETLGVSSPSTVFKEIGDYTMQGLALGVNDFDIYGALSPILSTIPQAFTDASSSSYSWGQDLAWGFANGINNGQAWVDQASYNIASIVQQYLHFSEPDVGPLSDFHTYMPDMLKEMAKGIDDNADMAVNAVADLSAAMSAQFQADAPMFAADSDYNVNVNRAMSFAYDDEGATNEAMDMAAKMQESDEQIINALYAVCERLVRTINDKDTDMYLDGEKITKRVTSLQEQYDRAYRR